MINVARFERSLVVGLVPVLVLALVMAFTPTGAMSLAGDPQSPGARLATDNVVIDRIRLSGTTVEGTDVARLDIGELERALRLVIERDVVVDSMVPGGGTYTFRIEAPAAVVNDVDLFTARACARGVGLTRFGLLEGLADPFLNSALANGYRPNLITALLNLIGPSGLIKFTIREFRAELVRLDAGLLRADSGLRSTFTPQVTSRQFVGSCLR